MTSHCYCIVLRKASRKLTSLYDAALEPLGVNIAQFSLLRRIGRHAPVSLTELGHQTELDRSTIGRNTKLLERMGLVATTTGVDQREAVLGLTEAGRQLLDDGAPLWDGVQETIETRLGGPQAAAALNDLLGAL